MRLLLPSRDAPLRHFCNAPGTASGRWVGYDDILPLSGWRSLRSGALVVVGLILALTTAKAQTVHTVRGQVSDPTGQPIPAAQVEFSAPVRRAVSRSDGTFLFINVSPGTYQLHVRRIGYSPMTLTLDLISDTLLQVTLQPVPRALDSIRVVERRQGATFTAVVVDDLDQPVADAEFLVGDVNEKLRTNARGMVVLRNPPRGTLVVRVRRLGYEAYFGTFLFEASRYDTLRMARLPSLLDEVSVLARSGFGRDTFAFIELQSRLTWKANGAGVIGREELDALGETNLCEALPRTQTGALLRMRVDPGRCSAPVCMLINGERPAVRPLAAFDASEVEAVEFYPPGSDWSGTLFSRAGLTCYPHMRGSRGPGRHPGGWVIWLRRR